jgi:hypothetical protein
LKGRAIMQHHKLLKLLKVMKNEDGIALVTSLMLTLITLAIIMSVMYLITSSIQHTGANKRYKSAMEAAYGGTELVVKDLFPMIMRDFASATLATDIANYSTDSGVNISMSTTQACLQAKLTLPTSQWAASCTDAAATTINPKSSPDLKITMPATNGTNFTVYSKIVDTVAGNTETSGLQLEGSGVAESSSVITPQHFPYIYRLEVQGERSSNAVEKSNISVLYAY